MSDTIVNEPSTKGKRPTHTAYLVRQYAEGKAEWIKLGVAWQRQDGSYDTQLYAVPLDGRIVHRPTKENA